MHDKLTVLSELWPNLTIYLDFFKKYFLYFIIFKIFKKFIHEKYFLVKKIKLFLMKIIEIIFYILKILLNDTIRRLFAQ